MKRMAWMLLGALLTAGAGCLDWENGIPCRTDRHCPTGKHCVDGTCEPGDTLPDAGVAPTDGGPARG